MSKYTAEFVEAEVEVAMTQGKHGTAAMFREFAALLRERESAKAAVTDEMIEAAMYACGGDKGSYWAPETYEDWRAALEAVAPMLASARVPDVDQELQFRAGMAFEKGITRRVLHDRPGLMGANDFCKFMLWLEEERQCHPEYRALAAAPKSEAEE